MRRSVGVIGLGIMGSAISANLVRAGFATFGYDVLQARNKALHRSGGIPLRSPAEVATHAPIVRTPSTSSPALRHVASELSAPGERVTIVAKTATLPIEAKQRARDVL